MHAATTEHCDRQRPHINFKRARSWNASQLALGDAGRLGVLDVVPFRLQQDAFAWEILSESDGLCCIPIRFAKTTPPNPPRFPSRNGLRTSFNDLNKPFRIGKRGGFGGVVSDPLSK